MTYLRYIAFTIGCLHLFSSTVFADEIVEFNITNLEEPVVVCVGDRDNSAKFGGYLIATSEARAFIPARDHNRALLKDVTITISSAARSAQASLSKLQEQAAVTLKDGADRNCHPDKVIKIDRYIKMRRAQNDMFAAQASERHEHGIFTPQFLKSMLDEVDILAGNAFAKSGITSVLPSAQDRAIEDAMGRAEKRRRAEAIDQAIEDFFFAAEEYARQRDAERKARLDALEVERQRKVEAEAARSEAQRLDVKLMAQRRCFGALGSACGAFDLSSVFDEGPNIQFSSCHRNVLDRKHTCLVNVGSWKHDECCYKNPNGWFCDGPGGGDTCSPEFWLGTARFVTPYNWWRRDIDASTVDRDGIVDKPEYCAKPGTIVLKSDTHRCCSGNEGLHFGDVAAFYLNHRAWVATLPASRKCSK